MDKASRKRPLQEDSLIAESGEAVMSQGEKLVEENLELAGQPATELMMASQECFQNEVMDTEKMLSAEDKEQELMQASCASEKRHSPRKRFNYQRKRSMDISRYVKKSMLENPWKELEKQQSRRKTVTSGSADAETAILPEAAPCKDVNVIDLDSGSEPE